MTAYLIKAFDRRTWNMFYPNVFKSKERAQQYCDDLNDERKDVGVVYTYDRVYFDERY